MGGRRKGVDRPPHRSVHSSSEGSSSLASDGAHCRDPGPSAMRKGEGKARQDLQDMPEDKGNPISVMK